MGALHRQRWAKRDRLNGGDLEGPEEEEVTRVRWLGTPRRSRDAAMG